MVTLPGSTDLSDKETLYFSPEGGAPNTSDAKTAVLVDWYTPAAFVIAPKSFPTVIEAGVYPANTLFNSVLMTFEKDTCPAFVTVRFLLPRFVSLFAPLYGTKNSSTYPTVPPVA